MTQQIEQLLLSKQDSNIRLGLTLYFSQGGSIVDFSKWIYDVFYSPICIKAHTTYLTWIKKLNLPSANADRVEPDTVEGLKSDLVTKISNFYKCFYLIDYIQENFKISRSDFRFIAKNIKDIRYLENTDISRYLELLVKSTELVKKIKNNLVNNLI